MFTTRFEAWVRRRAEALIAAVGRVPLTPNQVTVVGLVLTFVAATLVAFGQLRWAGVVLIFAGHRQRLLPGARPRWHGPAVAQVRWLACRPVPVERTSGWPTSSDRGSSPAWGPRC